VTTLAGMSGIQGRADGAGTAAQFSSPISLAVDRSGNVYVADKYNHAIRKITAASVVTTLAGSTGTAGSADGAGAAARFNRPSSIAIDRSGNLFVADRGNATIRRITASGVVTTLAGTAGSMGRTDGVGSAARFGYPFAIAVDGNGDVFVSDMFNVGSSRLPHYVHSLRQITGDGMVSTLATSLSAPLLGGIGFDSSTGLAVDGNGILFIASPGNRVILKVTADGTVTTFAGAMYEGSAVDGPIGSARFSAPIGLARDDQGNFFVSDLNSLRKISAGGLVTTLAGRLAGSPSVDGTGGLARFDRPRGVAVDGGGNLFVSDNQNCTIRKITARGVVTTVAGLAGSRGFVDGTGSAARFLGPGALAVDRSGTLFVTDAHSIRRITPDGRVTTLAGASGDAGSTDGTGSAARFFGPAGLAVDGSGNLWVADDGNSTIRKISPSGEVTTFAGAAGRSDSRDGVGGAARFSRPMGVAIDRDGNLIVADQGVSYAIRKISPEGVVTTLAGAFGQSGIADGIGSAARFVSPQGVAADGDGNVFVVDDRTIRKIAPGGVVTMVGGGGFPYFLGNMDASGRSAQFGYLPGIAVDGAGNLFVTDADNNTIRQGAPALLPARLINFSILTALAGVETMTVGTIVGGAGTAGTKSLLARAVGPSLAAFGVTGRHDDPSIEFYAEQTKRHENDDWAGAPELVASFARVGAFPFAGPTSKDAALSVAAVAPGNTTLRISGRGPTGGLVLAELYEAQPAAALTPTTPRLVNASVLKDLGAGLTAGFVIDGVGTKTVLVRAVGPSLAAFGVMDALADPQLELFDGQLRSIAANDNWIDYVVPGYSYYDFFRVAFSQVGAFPFSGAAVKEAALVAMLTAGNYTVQVRSADGTSGVVLVEIYELP
jgi:sugar lactone lactonase YvrE